MMKKVLCFWILAALFLAAATTLAGKMYSQDEAAPVCEKWAEGYAVLAQRRDLGAVKEQLLATLAEKEKAGEVSPSDAAAWRSALNRVYAHPNVTPQEFGDLVYESCMEQMTQQKI